jgi:hypothetical protein
LAQKYYLERHNSVAKVVHQALAKRYGLTETELPYYKCKPEQVLSNNKAKLLWDTPIITDRSVEVNRPDVVLFDKKSETAIIVDIAIPLDDNLETTIAEKKRKYLSLAVELKDIYKLKSTSIVLLVMSTNGLVTKEWSKSMEKLQLHERHCRTMQKKQFCAGIWVLDRLIPTLMYSTPRDNKQIIIINSSLLKQKKLKYRWRDLGY